MRGKKCSLTLEESERIQGIKFIDHSGETYGIYDVLKKTERKSGGHRLYECKCKNCGTIVLKTMQQLKMVENQPIDKCSHVTVIGEAKIPKVEFKNSRIHTIFYGMVERCYKKSTEQSTYYYMKGITVCDEWLKYPKRFEKWSLANGYTDEMTIDRIDESKGYSPENCRWISKSENSKFRGNTNIITATVSMPLTDWCKVTECSYSKLIDMLNTKGKEAVTKYIEEELYDRKNIG